MERMFKARAKQEEKRKLKAYRHTLFGKYSTQVPSILWTPHNSFPLPTSTAKFKGSEGTKDTALPSTEALKEYPFIPGQNLDGSIILRPKEYYASNNIESTEATKLYETIQLARQREGMDGSVKTFSCDIEQHDEPDIEKDEGFEVTELNDEELCFIRDVLKPPKRESIYNLGVEIWEQSGNNLHFEDAFRSMDTIHTFEDESGNNKTPYNSQGGDDNSSVSTVLEDGDDDDDDDDLISVLSALSERAERKEQQRISKQSQQRGSAGDEAQFVLQSWITSQQNDSNNDGGKTMNMSRDESWHKPVRVYTDQLKAGDDTVDEEGDEGYPGIEITETFDAEALFVQRKWKEDDDD
jgi:hypothetical protein